MWAKERGVTVNVVSIIGAECNLQVIGKLAELTGGQVERYNAHDLKNNVMSIVSLPTIASNVTLKVKLHKGLRFRREDPQNLTDNQTILVKELGNINEESSITFEYALKSINEIIEMEDIDLELIKEFPF